MTSNWKIEKNRKRILRKAYSIRKKVIFGVRSRHENTMPVFIMGCGRSGTTMLLDIIHRDHRIETLGENDPKIAGKNFMLKYEKLEPAIFNSKAPVIVMKPILNSFDAAKILTHYNKAQVLWIFRNHKDMIASSMKKFDNRVAVWMKELIVQNTGNNWIAKGIRPETKQILRKIDCHNFSDHDWMGLVWWSVNHTVIVDNLSAFEGFQLLQYEHFVRHQDLLLKKIYHIMGLKFESAGLHSAHTKSIGKGAGIALSPLVEKMCLDLQHKLENVTMR